MAHEKQVNDLSLVKDLEDQSFVDKPKHQVIRQEEDEEVKGDNLTLKLNSAEFKDSNGMKVDD